MGMPRNAPELAKWYMVEAEVPWDEDTFRFHLTRAVSLVGSRQRKGRYNPEEVVNGVLAYKNITGEYPESIGIVTNMTKDGQLLIKWANTPPEPPDIWDVPGMIYYYRRWSSKLDEKTKELIEYAITANQGNSGPSAAQLGV